MQTRLYLTPWTLLRFHLFSSSVISNKIHNYDLNKIKAFIISLSIHVTLLVSLIYLTSQEVHVEPLPKMQNRVTVSLLNSVGTTAPTKQSTKALTHTKTQPKTIQKRKLVKKEITKKKITKKAPVQKHIVKKQVIKKMEKKVLPKKEVAPVQQEIIPQKEAIVATETLMSAPTLTPLVTQNFETDEVLNTSNEKSSLQEEGVSPTTLGKIRSLIQNSLVYPAIARRMKIEGVVVVSFLLTEDGHVERANILTPSGSRTLDAKALKTVLALSGEYPHLNKKVDLQIPISFSLKNS